MANEFAVLVLLILSGIVLAAFSIRREKRKQEMAASRASERAEAGINRASRLHDLIRGEYLSRSMLELWLSETPDPNALLLSEKEKALLRPGRMEAWMKIEPLLKDPSTWAREYNALFVARRTEEIRSWADSRFGEPLTAAQRKAIVTDEDNTLILAGAGSGKTSTILAKTAYLLQWGLARKDEILILSFNKTVAEELRKRAGELDLGGVEISTFHAKGYELVGRFEGRKPAVSRLAEEGSDRRRFLEACLKTGLEDPEFYSIFERWWVYLRVEAGHLKSAATADERIRLENALGLESLTGVKLRSQAEVKVANWLSLNGLKWTYEATYPHSPPSADRKPYRPDFYLPTEDLWLEVWSCTETGKFPEQILAEPYEASMEWKRAVHREYGTRLLEVFQDPIWSGNLGHHLTGKLAAFGITPRELTPEEKSVLFSTNVAPISAYTKLVDTFLDLFRGGGWSRKEVSARASTERDRAFLTLFWRFLAAYETALEKKQEIDFHEMLFRASAHFRESPPTSYRHILVDEFQDTSRARLELLRALRASEHPARLYLVGDDWQSIYRFAGSDLSYLTEAEAHLGAMEQLALDRTFRLESDVEAVSSQFVMRNPRQLEKRLAPREASTGLAGVSIRFHDFDEEDAAFKAILAEIHAEDTEASGILVLGRYNFVLEQARAAVAEEGTRRGDGLKFLTVHRAKGLEADHVIALGLESGTYGFPSEIYDDRVLRLVLSRPEEFPNAEERRLFYVALTRTRGRVHLLAPNVRPSRFVQELLESAYAEFVEVVGEESQRYRCPLCQGKTIRRRMGPEGEFWACVHFPSCRGRLPHCGRCNGALEPEFRSGVIQSFMCIYCKREVKPCPRCRRGAVLEKTGKYGEFLGCSEWRRDGTGCGYSRNLSKSY